jgi:hypothetical protein
VEFEEKQRINLTEALLPPSERRDCLEDGREGAATASLLGELDLDIEEGALKSGSAGVEDLDMVALLGVCGSWMGVSKSA